MARHGPHETFDHEEAPAAPPSDFQPRRVMPPPKRNRQWERRQRDRKAVYRGVDPKYSLRVRSIATNLGMPAGEVARVLIGFSLRAYEQDDLDLRPRIRPTLARRTLHPGPERFQKPIQNHKSNAPQPTSWRVVTTWRNFSPELKGAISALASRDALNIPAGELVSALLRYGLNAYDGGLLKLERDEETGIPSPLEEQGL